MLLLMEVNSLSRQPLERLAESKFHDVSVRIAHHREISNDTSGVQRFLNQSVLLSCERGDAIDFFTRVALKPEMIETGFHFILDDYQNEDRIFARLSWRAEPDIVTAFEPTVTDDRKPAKRSVEIDRSVDVAAIDRDVGPTSGHVERRHPVGGSRASCSRPLSAC